MYATTEMTEQQTKDKRIMSPAANVTPLFLGSFQKTRSATVNITREKEETGMSKIFLAPLQAEDGSIDSSHSTTPHPPTIVPTPVLLSGSWRESSQETSPLSR